SVRRALRATSPRALRRACATAAPNARGAMELPKGAHRMFESVQPPPSEPGRFRAVLKLLALGVLVLLLLIPVNQLLGLVRERSSRRNEVCEELARTWGGEQTLGAVVLAVPYSIPAGAGVVATETWQ